MISKHLFALLACLFVVMIGFGITLPVLPFLLVMVALVIGCKAIGTRRDTVLQDISRRA